MTTVWQARKPSATDRLTADRGPYLSAHAKRSRWRVACVMEQTDPKAELAADAQQTERTGPYIHPGLVYLASLLTCP